MAALLSGFEEVNVVKPIGKVVMTVTASSIRFNKATAAALGFPAHVKVLVNEQTRQIALTPTTGRAENALKFSKPEDKQRLSISVKDKAVLAALHGYFTIGEAPEGEVAYVAVDGTAYPNDRIVIFNVADAVAGTMKRRGRRKASADAAEQPAE